MNTARLVVLSLLRGVFWAGIVYWILAATAGSNPQFIYQGF